MIKNKFAITIDCISLSFIVFIISFFWIQKYLNQFTLSIIISSIISLIILFLTMLTLLKKQNKQKINNEEKCILQKCKIQLKYNDIKTNINFFEKLLSAKYLSNNIYENNNGFFYIKTIGKIDSNDFFIANNFYKSNQTNKKLIFICELISDEFSAILNDSPIKFDIYSLENLFKIMQQKNIYPINLDSKTKIQSKLSPKIIIKKIKEAILYILNNIKIKDSFLSGLSLVILSAFVPFSLYYLIIGSVFLVISFISLFIKSKPNKVIINQDNNLEKLCK